MPNSKRPLVLTILDGWGYRAETADNAIALAKKPTYDKLLKEYPNTLMRATTLWGCRTGRWATARWAT